MMTRREGGSLTVDSPHVMEAALAAYRRGGVVCLAEEFVGERPALAAEKCYLRRWPGPGFCANSWHQDGTFIGTPLVLNGWLTFTDCGRDAPGMELLLRSNTEIHVADDQAQFEWAMSDAQVASLADADHPIVAPEFEAGDCLLFDRRLVHRTYRVPGMTNDRHSAETWFFAPSGMKDAYLPVLV